MSSRSVGRIITWENPAAARVVGLACLIALLFACFGGVLCRDQQFAFRDAAYFYYPLYFRVQEQWQSGHLPLWEPGENGGTSLLGSPMAAVLYPGKIVFALLPYAWAVRIYTVMHIVLAFGAMFALVRSWGVSLTARTSPVSVMPSGALSYPTIPTLSSWSAQRGLRSGSGPPIAGYGSADARLSLN